MNVKRIYLGLCGMAFTIVVGMWISTAYCYYMVNLSHSLPGKLYVVRKGGQIKQGDLVAYRWHGGAHYPAGTTFIKQLVGMPGDAVKRRGMAVFVNDVYIGIAKQKSQAGVPLTPAAEGVIPKGEYFMATPSPDSLDSRYSLSGNIKQSEVIGRAYEIF